jgi:uncharacterized membrane protein (DUF2068 family)
MIRPKTYTIAAILQFLVSVLGVILMFPLLVRGANEVSQSSDAPPYVVIMMAFVVAILGLVSAYGVWRNQRWGVILTIILRVVDGLFALPGIIAAPTLSLMVSAAIFVVLSIAIIALLLWPKPKLAPASRNA